MTLGEYLAKMKGTAKSPPGVGAGELVWSWIGAVLGIGLCGWLSARYFEPRDLTLLIGSFGASAVLVYGAIKSPLAQPRNLVGGHVISGLIGAACWQAFGSALWIAATRQLAKRQLTWLRADTASQQLDCSGTPDVSQAVLEHLFARLAL